MAKFLNRAGMTTATTGTGTITLGSAITDSTNGDYLTFAEAGIADGNIVRYLITDGSNVEGGTGTYTSSGTTLSRDTVTFSKIGGTAGTTNLTLSGSAKVYIVPLAEDQKWTRKSDGASWNGDVDRNAGPQEVYGWTYNVVAKWGTGHSSYDRYATFGGDINLWGSGGLIWYSSYTNSSSADTSIWRVSAGKLKITQGTNSTTYGDLVLRDLTMRPSASLTPANNGDLVVEATSNTTLTFKLKGSDGTVRTGTLTLA